MTINWTSEFDASISLFGFENSSINPFQIFDEFNTTGSYNDFNISTAIAILTLKSNRELWRDIPLGCTLTILSLLTLVGNALVLHAVRTERRLQTVSNMYIVSLAVADLIVGMFVMPISAIYIFTEQWYFGVGLCQLWISVDYIASTASIFNLFILSVDRYCSVKSPLKYIRKRTKKRALFMISFVWFLSSLWIIPIVGWHFFVFGGIRSIPSNVCETEYAKDSAFKVITAFFNFYLPLTIMICLYGKVFHEIRKRSALELGQRHTSKHPTVQFLPSLDSQTLDDSSENNLTTSLKEDSKMHFSSGFYSVHGNNCQQTTYRTRRRNNVIPKAYREFHVTEFNTRYIPKRRIEYIYDEGVFDSTTEKLERYYYKKQMNGSCQSGPTSYACDIGIDQSPPSGTPTGSSSSEDRQSVRSLEPPLTQKKKSLYSLTNGLKQIRQATNIMDHTSVASQKAHINGKNRLTTLNDDSHRRISKLLNIGHRLRNIRRSSSLTKEIKAARQLGVIMGAFTLCFLPYFILFLVVAFCDGCIDPGLLTAMTWIGYLNSTLNPFLYPLCNTNFRRKFRKMFGFKSRPRHRPDVNNTERNSFTMRYD
ncbi:histamine H1 receptor-like [Mytilus galloprovincialis]|uniref:histamine H1 receptor-like n=1 Tax=Mytilus galloprovincialis TaxID=29158 RepID=UPI003F7C80C5